MAINLDTRLDKVQFTILDTETTGVNLDDGHEIIEIGMVHFSGGEISDSFESLLRPSSPQTMEALSVHKISPENLKNAPSFADMAGRIIDFIGTTVIVAHNRNFDMTFIDTSLQRIGKPVLGNWSIDTLLLSHKLWPDFSCHCLRCLGPSLKLGKSGTHRALDDVIATTALLKKIIEELSQSGKDTLRDLHPVRKDFTWESGDLTRNIRQTVRCAIKKGELLDISLYDKNECNYYRRTIHPLRLEENILHGRIPGETRDIKIPIYNIITIN
jgi:DNA polymerase III epsilon subunit family exonuclease